MTPQEMLALLQRANAVDPRVECSVARAAAWLPYFADYPAEQVGDALHEHYRTSDRPVMPANLIALVRATRERLIDRNRAAIEAVVASDDTDRALVTRMVADGQPLDAVVVHHSGRAMVKALDTAVDRIGRMP